MRIFKNFAKKIFNKRYKIAYIKETDFTYACNGRIIRSLAEGTPKKTYCAAYVFTGLKNNI